MSTNLNTNKIAGAILLAGLIGMVAGKATEFLYDGGPQHAGGHHEEHRGFKIDVPEGETAGADGGAATAEAADISALYASADVAAGESYFGKKCAVCHNIEKGQPNKVGPELYGVMGRKVATAPGFSYSEAMKGHGDRSWTWDEMNHFQFKPRAWVPGTIMAYGGTPKDQERANLIVYLNSKSDSPLPLPPVTAGKKEEPTDPAKDSGSEKAEPKAAKDAPVEKAQAADSGNKNAAKVDEKANEPKAE